jgi:prefoldin subunit 5
MAFDPTKPVEYSPLDAAEMRNQLNALKALIDGQQSQMAAMNSAIAELQDAVNALQGH